MAYGTLKVDTIICTDNGVDRSITVSGLSESPISSGNLTLTGTISGTTIRGQTVSGVTVTGGTASFGTGTFSTITGGLATIASGVFPLATITSGVFATGTAAAPSISFSGDSNTGLYSPAADEWAVSAGGSERLRVASSRVQVTAAYDSNISAVAALNIDCSTGNFFTKTINANSTFTVSNIPSSRAYAFTLELTHTSGTITWFSGVVWPGGTAPTLTTNKVHLFMFVTDDGGTTWRASSLINY
jgi:hypothetical protein